MPAWAKNKVIHCGKGPDPSFPTYGQVTLLPAAAAVYIANPGEVATKTHRSPFPHGSDLPQLPGTSKR